MKQYQLLSNNHIFAVFDQLNNTIIPYDYYDIDEIVEEFNETTFIDYVDFDFVEYETLVVLFEFDNVYELKEKYPEAFI